MSTLLLVAAVAALGFAAVVLMPGRRLRVVGVTILVLGLLYGLWLMVMVFDVGRSPARLPRSQNPDSMRR